MLQAFMGKIFGTANDRELKKYNKRVENINDLEANYSELSDDDLRSAFLELKNDVLNKEKTLDVPLSLTDPVLGGSTNEALTKGQKK